MKRALVIPSHASPLFAVLHGYRTEISLSFLPSPRLRAEILGKGGETEGGEGGGVGAEVMTTLHLLLSLPATCQGDT